VWALFIAAFVPNTYLLMRSVGYALWLSMNVMVVFAAVQLFGQREWMLVMLRWYLASFLVMSLVGLVQLALGVAHLPAPYVQQWMVRGVFPRMNGFSYEPSYYASFLLMGWVLSAWLLEKGSELPYKRLIRVTFFASTAALILSTSKLGWGMMLLWGSGYVLRNVSKFTAPQLSLRGWFITLNLMLMFVGGAGALLATSKVERFLANFVGGTGLLGTAGHSADSRQHRFLQTVELVEKSPLIGYSLGGVGPAIGKLDQGAAVMRLDHHAKPAEGMAIFAEVLAASGVVGFVPFLVYVWMLIALPYRAAQRTASPYGSVLSGLVWALLMEFLVLQFNQNVLRPYLWFHIAVLSATYSAVVDKAKR
jgi:hypothetical protein